MNRYEAARKAKMEADPEYAAARRAHDNRPRPDRRRSAGSPGPKTPRGPRRPSRAILCPIDGEGFEFPCTPYPLPPDQDGKIEWVDTESRYCLLQILGRPPLWNEEGLTTEQVFQYLFDTPSNYTLVGYGLGYDFENWLRDIPDEDYYLMVNGGEETLWRGWLIRYIPRKMLILQTTAGQLYRNAREPHKLIRRTVYDSFGYFQTSLVKALEKNHIAVSATITEGKAARGGFRWEDRESVAKYNLAELTAMRRLFESLRTDVNEGLAEAGLPIQLGANDWYGPGALAKKLLRYTKWPEEHPILHLSSEVTEKISRTPWTRGWDAPYVDRFPFSAAYVGGRIEISSVGRWDLVHDQDLHNAYPCAMTRLPKWGADDGRYLEGWAAAYALRSRQVGMYLIEWDLPEGWDWYPLPYRNARHNVYFPSSGMGWVMSPEALAVLDTCGWDGRGAQGPMPEETEDRPRPRRGVVVHAALVLSDTDGLGDGCSPVPIDKRSTAADVIVSAYACRQRLVAAGKPSEKGIKLVLVSSYGKLWQQVGIDPDEDVGLFGDLSGAWITSWTRAMIWRRIWGRHTGHQVIAIQTDGVASVEDLGTEGCGEGLGEWESTQLEDYRQFLPGIYDYREGEKRKKKTRGFTTKFDPDQAWRVVTGEQETYGYTYRFFVGRRHALAQPKRYGMSRYQWREARKDFRILLGSKRVQPEPAKAEVSRLLSQVETLASHLRRERAEMRRQMRQSILYATEGQLIKPGPLTRGLPSSLLRRKSPWGMDGVAEALHMDDSRLRQQLLSIYGPQSRDDRSEAMRMILESDEYQTAVAKAMRQKLKKARGPLWTRPKPNPSWDMRGESSHPFRLKFDQTPYVGTDGELPRGGDAESIAVRMQMEDAEGEEGMFVAGIGE